MKQNKWTSALVAAGLLSVAAATHAEEASTPLLTAVSSTTLSGYISTSMVWNPASHNGGVAGLVQNVGGVAQQDGFNLDVVSLTLDKPISDEDWAAGYHVQLLLGPGANQRGTSTIASGFGGGEVAFNEAYVALKIPVGNGIILNIGQFGTYNGYEAYDVYKNPNFTKSYGFYNETSAHTGVKASYKVNDVLSLSAAVANTGNAANGGSSRVDAKAPIESKKAVLGMINLTAPDSVAWLKGASLGLGALSGPGNGVSKTTSQFYVGGTLPTFVDGLTIGFGYDYTAPDSVDFVPANAYANSIAGYVGYKLTEKLTSNSRVDYGTSSAGWYYAGVKPQKLISLTETLDYALWKNVITRGEVRWDHSLTGDKPYGGGSYHNNVLLLLNVVYLF